MLSIENYVKAIVQKQNEIQVSVLLLEKQKKIKENIIQDKREENNALNQEQTLQSMSLARLSKRERVNKSLEEKIIQRKNSKGDRANKSRRT